MGISKTASMSVLVDTVTLGLKLDVNYNQIPCDISLNIPHMKLERIDVDLSMFSFFNSHVSQLLNIFESFVKEIIKTKFKEVAKEPIENLNCERYRP